MSQLLKIGTGAAALLLAGAALAQAEAPAAAETTASQIVVRDATTGALRAATPVESRALTGEPTRSSIRLNTAQRSHFSGARGVRLSDEFMNHAVVTRLPDGSLVEQCFHTAEEAALAHKPVSVMKAPAPLPTE